MSLVPQQLLVPQNTVQQTLVGFNAVSIENGFILTKTYFIREAGGVPYQTQRATFFPTLDEVVKNLQIDVV